MTRGGGTGSRTAPPQNNDIICEQPLTHTENDEYSGKAESHQNAETHQEAGAHNNKEDKVEVIVPPVSDEAEEANRALTEDRESQL